MSQGGLPPGRRAGRRALLVAGLVTLVSGLVACGTAPPAPERPSLGLTEDDRFAAASAGAPQPTLADLQWWQRFDDPAMAVWVERTLSGSPDIAIARERITQAQALLQVARAQRGIQLGAQARADLSNRRNSGARALQPGAALTWDWDTDLWGGLRQAEQSAAAGVLRSQDMVQSVRLASAGLSARAVIEWRQAQRDAQLLAQAVSVQREILRVVQVRFDVGLAPRLDLDRAQAEVAVVEAEAARAAMRTRQALVALQVLAGERPEPMALVATQEAAFKAAPVPVPALVGALPAVRPIDLLRLRPDLRAAEQALLIAAAEVGVAQAALRPSLRLPGTLLLASGAGVLELVTAAVSAVLEATLFDGGRRGAEVDAATSRAREAASVYRRTLLQALQQVESTLVAAEGTALEIAALERARGAADAAVEQAQVLYTAGLTGFIDVLDARRSALTQQRQLLRARADSARQAVAGFEAMGLVDAPSVAGSGPPIAMKKAGSIQRIPAPQRVGQQEPQTSRLPA